MKLNTYNVIVLNYGSIQSMLSFSYDEEGKKEAESHFLSFIVAHNLPIENAITNGYSENRDGTITIFLTTNTEL